MHTLNKEEYNFVPRTWVLPADYGSLAFYMRDCKRKQIQKTLIVKPHNGARGRGYGCLFSCPPPSLSIPHPQPHPYLPCLLAPLFHLSPLLLLPMSLPFLFTLYPPHPLMHRIRLIHTLDDGLHKEPVIVQEYIDEVCISRGLRARR